MAIEVRPGQGTDRGFTGTPGLMAREARRRARGYSAALVAMRPASTPRSEDVAHSPILLHILAACMPSGLRPGADVTRVWTACLDRFRCTRLGCTPSSLRGCSSPGVRSHGG